MPKKFLEKASEVARARTEELQRQTDAINEKLEESSRYTQREIEGAIRALNIFFGAVIGISLGDIGAIPTEDYVIILVATAAIVTSILLVSYTHRRIWNAVSMVSLIGLSWWLVEHAETGFAFIEHVPDKLLPTLAVWGAMALATEFSPRAKEPAED